MKRVVLVTGAGGFIGHHLVSFLRQEGHRVYGIDQKYPEFGTTQANIFAIGDLREKDTMWKWFAGVGRIDEVYALAADMGGMGFISKNHAAILRNNLLINLYTLEAVRRLGIKRYLFSSSACVYPDYLQTQDKIAGLKETDAYPAQPQDAYGWEKLTTERIADHYGEEHGINVRIARFHNIFGPRGTWQGGREKAPAAICRKIAKAKLEGAKVIEVWGDGKQTRSFCYITDCVFALERLMRCDFPGPVNIGTDRAVSINELVEIVSKIANWPVEIKHVKGPQGVRGRNSDNALAEYLKLGKPLMSLEEGLKFTYQWIEQQVQTCAA